MVIAEIIAGGVGNRMKMEMPKQFFKIHKKPILVYTLEVFQENPIVDDIVVVCLAGWEDVVESYKTKYHITKLKAVIKGGSFGQESIKNGIDYISTNYNRDDIVLIHDGIRPLVDDEVLNDAIATCKTYGNGVSTLPYNEQIFVKTSDFSTKKYIPRDNLVKVVTPQAYKVGIVAEAYEEAFDKKIGISNSSYTNTMMVELGHELYFSSGSNKNIKLTTPEDIELFKALLELNKKS
jgi:2-C-methyl-D-erythritol 4-phosphate cytidylyltransferase